MEEKENKRISLLVGAERSDQKEGHVPTKEKIKKPLIFCLMGIVFFACLYLIFKPKNEIEDQEKGLKNAVPEATDKGLQADKQKAYEKEELEEKEAEKRNSLMSLSDYWNTTDSGSGGEPPSTNTIGGTSGRNGMMPVQNNPLASYQNAQYTLDAFYRDDDREKLQLRRQVDQLKERLSEKDVPQTPTLKDQLALMEKSYEMASRYLPTGATPQGMAPQSTVQKKDSVGAHQGSSPIYQDKVATVRGNKKSVVSFLSREQDEQAILKGLGERNLNFITPGKQPEADIIRNSIRAMVMESKTIAGEGPLKLRLSESAVIGGREVPRGTELVADAKIQGNRLQLKVSSIEVSGSILPVEINVYGMDGQPGLFVPRSDEINAAGEIAANMAQSSGMNISMSRSAGQQVAGDVSRGLLQGISGYFSKKLRAVKVTVRSGHEVLLVPKR